MGDPNSWYIDPTGTQQYTATYGIDPTGTQQYTATYGISQPTAAVQPPLVPLVPLVQQYYQSPVEQGFAPQSYADASYTVAQTYSGGAVEPAYQTYTNPPVAMVTHNPPLDTTSPQSYSQQQAAAMQQTGYNESSEYTADAFDDTHFVQKYPTVPPTKPQTESSTHAEEEEGGGSIDDYLKQMESNMKAGVPPPLVQESSAVSLRDRLAALAQHTAETVEAGDDPELQTKAAQLGPLPKMAKVVTQELDPAMFQPRKKSRFDQGPTSSPFATGANAIPVGAKPTMVLNKYSISSALKTTKKNPKKACAAGVRRKEDGTMIIPENTCTVDIRIQRAIMQQVAGMKEFKFTIGINKMYKGIMKNQKNKKKDDPLKLEEEVDIDTLVQYCEEMTHLLRVKKKKYIKILPHVTPYIMSGVCLWAMFHGRSTRRTIRDNWCIWVGANTPDKIGLDWDFYFQLVRTVYMSCDKKQRHKYRSRDKGIDKYLLRQVMWSPNKSVNLEKLHKELKCQFAIKKVAQQFVRWKILIKNCIQRSKILCLQHPGDFVTFKLGLKHLIGRIDTYLSSYTQPVTFDNMVEFEADLRRFCMRDSGFTWEKWGISLPFLIKLYNCSNSSQHRPDRRTQNPLQIRVAFNKVFKPGFKEFKLPVQRSRLGESTVPAMVQREMRKRKRKEEKIEIKKIEAQLAALEAQKRVEEEKRKLEEAKEKEKALWAENKEKEEKKEKIKEMEEQIVVPSNEDYLKQFATPEVERATLIKREIEKFRNTYKKEKVSVQVEVPVEEVSEEEEDVSDDPDESFNFDPLYTYRQYIQPLQPDVLYEIPDGTRVEDEIKLRVENQPTGAGIGYGLALSDTHNSVLFVFYPFGKTVRISHFTNANMKHHHRIYGNFLAAKTKIFQLTIKVKRNRFEVITDDVCIKTVPAFLDTSAIQTVMFTGGTDMPFVNFRIRSVSPSLPVLPYMVRRRHQKGLSVALLRHKDHGIVTKIGKIGGDSGLFLKHLTDMLTSVNNNTTPPITAVTSKVLWITGHFKEQVVTWLKTIGF